MTGYLATIGDPFLFNTAHPMQVVKPSSPVRQVVNMTALAMADAATSTDR